MVDATMRSRWLAGCLVAAAVAVGSSSGVAQVSRPSSSPRADACASLGDAAPFAVFSDGDFNASDPAGTSVTGRIAAGGDVILDGVSIGPGPGDASPEIIAGQSFIAGQTIGHGGSVSGGVLYGGSLSVASNFTVSGGTTHGSPPFSFTDAFTSLSELSSSLASEAQTPGATVTLNPYSAALQLTGTGAGLNVFTVTAAQLSEAAGVIVDLTQPGATALVNIVTDTDLTIAPQYLTLEGSATAASLVWNLPLATSLAINRGVAWDGLILAPNATVTGEGRPQLNGELIAHDVIAGDWVFSHTAFTGCLPPPPVPPLVDTSLSLQSLCVDANGALDMRLRNTGDTTRTGDWEDVNGTDFGQFSVPAHSDLFFTVAHPTAQSLIRATSGSTTVQAAGTLTRCTGQITVHLVTAGDAPAGQTWDVRITGGDTGNVSQVLTMADGDTDTVTVPGGYEPGVAAIDQVVGGIPYAISEDDAHGAQVSISLNPVEILVGQNEYVVVTNAYASTPGGSAPPPTGPEQPTLPPGAPDPPAGPDLIGGAVGSGADLAIAHTITPRRVPVDGIVETVTEVRNLGPEAAVGVVARELPQLRPLRANTVAHVLSITTTKGTCTQRRPVRCALGTLTRGAAVTIRTRTRILVAAVLHSVVVVSSDTPDSNPANNLAQAGVTTYLPATAIRAHVSAPPVVPFGRRFSYRVSITGGAPTGALAVQLCTRPPAGLLTVRAPGTFRSHGRYCRNIAALPRGRTVSFLVSAVPSRSGRFTVDARGTAAALSGVSRDTAPVRVGAVAACAATRPRAPVARAAC